MSQIQWDVEGMDGSWSCSFINDIPQVDGAGEEKPIQSNEPKEKKFREERNTLYSSDRLIDTNCSKDISVLTKNNASKESGSLKRGSQLSSFGSEVKRSYGLFGIRKRRCFSKATALSDSSMSNDVKVDESWYSNDRSFKNYSQSKSPLMFAQRESSLNDDGQKEELVNCITKANSPETGFGDLGDSFVKQLEHNRITPSMFFPAGRETKLKGKDYKNIAKECEKSLQHINASNKKEEIPLDSIKTRKTCFQTNTEQIKMCEISSEKLKRNKDESQFTLVDSNDAYQGIKHQNVFFRGDTETYKVNFRKSLNVALTDARFSEKLKTAFAVAEGRLNKCLGASLPRNINDVMKETSLVQTRASTKRKLFLGKEKQDNVDKQVLVRKTVFNDKPTFERLSNSKTRNRRIKAAIIEKEKINVVDENLLHLQGYENKSENTKLHNSKILEQSCKSADNVASSTKLHAEEAMRLSEDFKSKSASDKFKNSSFEEYQSGTSMQKEKLSSILKDVTVTKKGTPKKKLYERKKHPKEAALLRRGNRIRHPVQKYEFTPLQFEKSQELSFARSCKMIRTEGLGTPKENPLPTFTKEDNPQLKSQLLSNSVISNQNQLSPVPANFNAKSRKQKMTVEIGKDCNIVSPTVPKRKRFSLHNRPPARRQTKDKDLPVIAIKQKVSAKSKPPVTKPKRSSESKTSVEDEIKLLESDTSILNEQNSAKSMALLAGEERKLKSKAGNVDQEKLTRRTKLKAPARAEGERNYRNKNCRGQIGVKQKLLNDHTKREETSSAPRVEQIEESDSANTPQRLKLIQEKVTETEIEKKEVRETRVSSFDDLEPYLGFHGDQSRCNSFDCLKRDDGYVEVDDQRRASNSELTGLSTFLTSQANSSVRLVVAVCDVSKETLPNAVENYEVTMIPDSPIDFNLTVPDEEEMSTHKKELSFDSSMQTSVECNLGITRNCCREAIDFASSLSMENEENVSTPENTRKKESLTNPKVKQTDLQANALFNMSFMSPSPSDESPQSPPDPSSPQMICVEQHIADIKTEQGSQNMVPDLIFERRSENDAGENVHALQSQEKEVSCFSKSSFSFSKNVEVFSPTTKYSNLSHKALFERLDDWNESVKTPKQSEPIDEAFEIIATSFTNENSLSLENQKIRYVENSKCERVLESFEVRVEEQSIVEKGKQQSNFQSLSQCTSKREKLHNTLNTQSSSSFSSGASPLRSNSSLQELCEGSSKTVEGMKKSAEESDSSSPKGQSGCSSNDVFFPENEVTSSTEENYSNAAISTTSISCGLHEIQRRESSSPSNSFALNISQCSDTEENVSVIKPFKAPPSAKEVIQSLSQYGMPHQKHQDPFCSDPDDIPEIAREIGSKVLKVKTKLVKDLRDFQTSSCFQGLKHWRIIQYLTNEGKSLDVLRQAGEDALDVVSGIERNSELKLVLTKDFQAVITPSKLPPSKATVMAWATEKLADKKVMETSRSQVKILKGVEEELSTWEDEKSAASNCPEEEKKKTVKSSSPEEFISFQRLFSQPEEVFTSSKVKEAQVNKPEGETKNVMPPRNLKENSNVVSSQFPDGRTGRRSVPEHLTQHDDALDYDPPHSTPVSSRYLIYQGSPRCTPINPVKGTLLSKCSDMNYMEDPSQPVPSRFSKKPTQRRKLISSQLKFSSPLSALKWRQAWSSQIEGPSLNNTYGFRVSQQNLQDARALHEVQHLTQLSIELHVQTRRDLRPDPEYDPICAIFYYIVTDTPTVTEKNKITGILCVDGESATLMQRGLDPNDVSVTSPVGSDFQTAKECSVVGDCVENRSSDSRVMSESCARHTSNKPSTSATSPIRSSAASHRPLLSRCGITNCEVHYVQEEKELFTAFEQLVRTWDPDILLGYEVQMLSWGYLFQRAKEFEMDLIKELSRVKGRSNHTNMNPTKDQWGARHTSEISIPGRIMLNVWRLMKHEVTLNVYSFENVAFHVLHTRIPLFTFRTLSEWWNHKSGLYRWRTVEHYLYRCQANIKILQQLDFIGRTSELARLFGILFYSVISRGSQYRVESMMLRIAKPMNYIAVSPSVQQRSQMHAPECIALVMEPESQFYSNPVLVLDFQSLYPSIIIAYNYCFSTCLGRVSCLSEFGEFKFGATSLSVPPSTLKKLENDIHISPNGVAFVNPSVRRGVLPRMLDEILKTRIMVKASMKKYKENKGLQHMLDARQLGLKLIANVTYGYTSAHFSGRMPCVEIGDSIVRKARETLERAIDLVNRTAKWGGRVIYGDTDSLFVLLQGATKEEAFKIGQEIVQAVTETNPKPVKLKFEKVYLPCVLQTKKRYVGYMYETLDQKEPVFDAKGIETVRRDSCPAVAKILEKSLRTLFESRDISLVKRFVQRQCRKLMEDRTSLQDFTFAKEYRGMNTYKPGACVPALELTRRMLKEDRRSEPRVGERVPYVVVYGSPGLPLIQLVRRPEEVLQDACLRLNASYYINKQILPPLDRVFSLIGTDVRKWYIELPRVNRVTLQPQHQADTRKGTISQYFTTLHCPVCEQVTNSGLCRSCRNNPQMTIVTLSNRIRNWERKHQDLSELCYQCCGSRDRQLCCVSLDCPVLYKLVRVTRDLKCSQHLRDIQSRLVCF